MDASRSQPFGQVQGFDWDAANAEKLWTRHRVGPNEAEEVFLNVPVVVGPDAGHSVREARYFLLGRTNDGRKLYVVFTMWSGRIRVVTARDMSRKERSAYEQEVRKDEANPTLLG